MKQLKEKLQQLGVTQHELAEKTNTAIATVNSYLNKPSRKDKWVKKVCEIYKIEL
jgi:transcriptional regulator with XRE-family HTH domain